MPFIIKAWLLLQGIGEAGSQFYPPLLKTVSWVMMGIKTKEKKSHVTPGEITFSCIKESSTTVYGLELMRTRDNLKSFLFRKLNGIFSESLNDKSKVGISSLVRWALGEVVFF